MSQSDHSEKTSPAPALRFTGDGSAYLPGVPARDLAAEEIEAVAAASGLDEDALVASGLYAPAAAPEPEPEPPAPEPEPHAVATETEGN